jgi:hypothetical protein
MLYLNSDNSYKPLDPYPNFWAHTQLGQNVQVDTKVAQFSPTIDW